MYPKRVIRHRYVTSLLEPTRQNRLTYLINSTIKLPITERHLPHIHNTPLKTLDTPKLLPHNLYRRLRKVDATLGFVAKFIQVLSKALLQTLQTETEPSFHRAEFPKNTTNGSDDTYAQPAAEMQDPYAIGGRWEVIFQKRTQVLETSEPFVRRCVALFGAVSCVPVFDVAECVGWAFHYCRCEMTMPGGRLEPLG